MITLSVLVTIWFAISTYRIYIRKKRRGGPFDMDEPYLIDHIGFSLGISIFIIYFIIGCFEYMP